MGDKSVLIIGAGAAGLAAGRALARGGVEGLLLEARDRIGGRIYTITSPVGELPIELGAEFVHGEENETWEVIHEANLRTQVVPDRHWHVQQGGLAQERRFWEKLAQATARINTAAPDQDFQSFLDEAWGLKPSVKKLALDYVEGFHAAAANQISIHALAKAEAAAETEEGTRQFRMKQGYAAVLRWLIQDSFGRGATIHPSTIVKRIRWEPGQVEVMAQTPAGQVSYQAGRVLVTLPLGVLQQEGPGAISFEPRLPGKERAIRSLAMGRVVKLALQFRTRFWPVKNFGFIHANEARLPTWWADARGPLLTGWAGGPKAEQLAGESQDALVAEAIGELSALFRVDQQKIQELLVASYWHDWWNDPFTCGAYSYTPVNMIDMPARLGAPVAGTLFFAGEATNSEGDQGTVHGALASGHRAAREILESMQNSVVQRRLAPMAAVK